MRAGAVFVVAVLVAVAGLMYVSAWRVQQPAAGEVLEGDPGASVAEERVAPAAAGAEAVAVLRKAAGASAPDVRKSPDAGAAVFYQYVDERGSVRLVQSLEAVPPEWRDRAGRIEIEARAPSPAAAPPRAAAGRSRARSSTRGVTDQVWGGGGAEVLIYTTSWCGACKRAIAYLEENDIDYTEYDIEDDDSAHEEYLEKLRASNRRRGVPLIDVDGSLLQGFDPRALRALLSGRG